MSKIILAAIVTMCSAPALALYSTEYKTINVPELGVVTTVSVGSQVHEYSNEVTTVRDAIIIDTEMRSGVVVAPAGTEFYPVRAISDKVKFKACVDPESYSYCGFDDDGDGTFDRMQDTGVFAKKLTAPVPYSAKKVTSKRSADSFKQVVLYQGATSDTLRLSYREFKNNIARDAFTQELTIPLDKTFPQDIAVKAVKLRIHKINGLGMTYEVLP